MVSFDMLRTGRYPLLRRLALVVAVAQGLLYAGAPFAEAQLEHPPQPAGIERNHTHACTALHQPDKCVFCQLATMRARRAEAVAVSAGGRTTAVRTAGRETLEPERSVHRPTRSRAPPVFLG